MADKDGKIFFEKKEFLIPEGDDKTTVDGVVRRYEYGGHEARLNISSPTTGFEPAGLNVYCSPGSKESLTQAKAKIDAAIAMLKEFRSAIIEASKDEEAEGPQPSAPTRSN